MTWENISGVCSTIEHYVGMQRQHMFIKMKFLIM
jgi:hypothetical protein